MIHLKLPFGITIALCLISAMPSPAQVKIYPAPTGAPQSLLYSLTVNGQSCFVYNSDVQAISYSYFDFSNGPIEIKITALTPDFWAGGVTIRPLSMGIQPAVNGNTVTFSISKPCKISIEQTNMARGWLIHDYRGWFKGAQSLFLFANEPEVNPPGQGDPNVVYFGPGMYTQNIDIDNDKTVYIAGGAYIKGSINANRVDNIKVIGRGVIVNTASRCVVRVNKCKNVRLEGIIAIQQGLRPTVDWQNFFTNSSYLYIENYKVIGGNDMWTDGLHMQTCSNVNINDNFVMAGDDIIAIDGGPSHDISITNCTFWQEYANVIRLGFPHYSDLTLTNFTMKNCDVIHHLQGWDMWWPGSFLQIGDADDIQPNAGKTSVNYVTIENIRIEECYKFIGIYLPKSESITNIKLKDITLLTPPVLKSNIFTQKMQGIVFENIVLNNHLVKNTDDLNIEVMSTIPDEIQFADSTGFIMKPITAPVTLVKVLPGDQTIFTTQVPVPDSNYTVPTSKRALGTRFKANANGKITKVRIYAREEEGANHIVKIFNAWSGLLVSGPFTWNITPGIAGWKTFDLPEAINIDKDMNYIVTVLTGDDYNYYSTIDGYTSAINNGNLITDVGGGHYSTFSDYFPIFVVNDNYFRDVVFVADEFTTKSAFTLIEAENYFTQLGVQKETCSEGGQNIKDISNSDYTVYENIDFGNGASSFDVRVASKTNGGIIEVRLDNPVGPLVGTCTVEATGDWQNWITKSCSISGATGVHNLYLRYKGNTRNLLNVNWFIFNL